MNQKTWHTWISKKVKNIITVDPRLSDRLGAQDRNPVGEGAEYESDG